MILPIDERREVEDMRLVIYLGTRVLTTSPHEYNPIRFDSLQPSPFPPPPDDVTAPCEHIYFRYSIDTEYVYLAEYVHRIS